MRKLATILLLALLCLSGVWYYAFAPTYDPLPTKGEQQSFEAKGVPPGSKATYDLQVTMHKNHTFSAQATIHVTNTSNDTWNDLQLYFIPNMFTKENAPDLTTPGSAAIQKMTLQHQNTSYTLKKDQLIIPLRKPLSPKEQVTATIAYTFTLPENGLRFTNEEGNYYLAQWYPMVATYRNGWNKQPYARSGETYHTAFSDFTVSYKAPSRYTVVSTSADDSAQKKQVGTLTARNVKEFFIAFLQKPSVASTKVGQTTLNVWRTSSNHENEQQLLQTASQALSLFNKSIGPYPYKELDVVLGNIGMEYPGIVTAGTIYRQKKVSLQAKKDTIVHEIAHQWFYGVISNDPYHDAWLDEGMAVVATRLYSEKYPEPTSANPHRAPATRLTLPVNLPLNAYPANLQSAYIYGKASGYLWNLLQKNGSPETFLQSYYNRYRYKEVSSQEFKRFAKHALHLENDDAFRDWLR
ncbi:M1 family metallopeptidase [Fictibacillus macauensis]|nr:M1 family metallopeptidase [Fictibacillus macauensis]